jgi:hypothetical protein
LYLDEDVQKKEAEEVFVQLTDFLLDFAEKNEVVIVATHPLYFRSKRKKFFREALCRKANVVASIRKFNHRPVFVLEKHSLFRSGYVEFASDDFSLLDFMEA